MDILQTDTAHVWAVDLERETFDGHILTETLSADEWMRADRFLFEKHRAHFVAARGCLRAILAKYMECKPGELAFFYGEHGKPALASPWDKSQLRFNLSHSAGLALIAVSLRFDIGVDVEHLSRKVGHMQDLAKRFFAPGEYKRLRALPREEQRRAFFHCWTRKEAYLKAVGTGLVQSLKNFEVSLGRKAKLLWIKKGNVGDWTLRHLEPAKGYVGSVAIAKKDVEVKIVKHFMHDLCLNNNGANAKCRAVSL
ncbi:MAG: 4'-phosphopantetheinyl transferase superfamily protein [Gemmatimonadetes bacterium]|nr:4'-phosphopantetheinyl transferase superfamily protein [Gemmatimonadota bacterium]